MKIQFRPWIIPNHAIQEIPGQTVAPPCWRLENLDEETLSELCDNFRRGVFKKAGKKDPNIK